jgi:hypothetical protein
MSGAMPGMTRQAGQLTREPGNLIHNYKAYALAIHAREAYFREYKGNKYNLTTLADASRRLTTVDFVTFLTLFSDMMTIVIAPWTLTVQTQPLEPWALNKKKEEAEKRVDLTISLITCLRKFIRVLFLLRQHLSFDHIMSFLKACLYAGPEMIFGRYNDNELVRCRSVLWVRHFPTFIRSLPGLLAEKRPTFCNVHLCVPCLFTPYSYALYGAHCQCSFLAAARLSDNPQLVVRSRRGRTPEEVKAKFSKLPKSIKWLASWVFNAPPLAETAPGGLPPMRVHMRDRDASAPLGVPQEGKFRNRFRCAGNVADPEDDAEPTNLLYIPRCEIPLVAYQVFQEMDVGLRQAGHFMEQIQEEGKALYGSEGENPGMATVVRLMSQCFDFGRLVTSPPKVGDIDAFAALVENLRPFMQYTDVPQGARSPMPSPRDLKVEYVYLMSRVRRATYLKPEACRDWWMTKGYNVRPLFIYENVLAFVRSALIAASLAIDSGSVRLDSALMAKVAACLSRFLGEPIDRTVVHLVRARHERPPTTFYISRDATFKPGWPRRRPGATIRKATREKWRYEGGPGGVAVVSLRGSFGKLVYVENAVTELDWSAVSASIDMHPYFSGELGSRHSAWWAAKAHNFARPMGSPEACCERVVASSLASLPNHTGTQNILPFGF